MIAEWTLPIVLTMVSIAGIWVLELYLKARVHNAERYTEYAHKFYASARPLLADKETPVPVLHLLDFINRRIVDRRSAFHFLSFVGSGAFVERDEHVISRLATTHEFFKRRTELKKSYSDSLVSGFLAMSYNGGVGVGFLLRAWLSGGTSADDETVAGAEPRSESVVAKFWRVEECAA